jgi:hypothetical protein
MTDQHNRILAVEAAQRGTPRGARWVRAEESALTQRAAAATPDAARGRRRGGPGHAGPTRQGSGVCGLTGVRGGVFTKSNHPVRFAGRVRGSCPLDGALGVFSPCGRSCDHPALIAQFVGELGIAQRSPLDVFDEHRLSRCEVLAAGGVPERVDDPYRYPELAPHQVDRFCEIRVVGDHHCGFAVLKRGVGEHVGGEVDVRPLLFGFDDLDRLRPAGDGIGQGHPRDVLLEAAQVDREVRRGGERSQVGGLSPITGGVVGARGDSGSEVADPVDPVAGEHCPGEGVEVQPLVRGALEAAIEEVESVDVHVDQHSVMITSRSVKVVDAA